MLDSITKGFVSGLDEVDVLRFDMTDEVGFIDTPVIAVLVDGHIQVDNVTIFKWTVVRNAMADDLIDGPGDLGEEEATHTHKHSLGTCSS